MISPSGAAGHISHQPIRAGGKAAVPIQQLGWFAAITALAFLVPYLFTTLLRPSHDLYYLAYFGLTATALVVYVRSTSFDLGRFFSQNWLLSIVLGAASTAFVVWNVLARNDATPHPTGAYYLFEIAWRGVAYGLVDAALLNVFPGMVAFALHKGDLHGIVARVQFGAIALALTVAITGAYHLGYEQFREDGLAKPETGNTIIELPLVVSANPIGSIVAHTAMHIAAVTHAYETDTFLPPQTFVEDGDGE